MDEHEGKGGSYMIDGNGKRVLVERTDAAPDELSPPAAPAAAEPAAKAPAKAAKVAATEQPTTGAN